ncbi:MAG: hypothetical protein IJR49_05990, partial [Treponema sp.]|nr:hypothetical protein [Treponema sp.]
MKIQAKIKSRTKSFIICAAFFLITSFCYSEVLLEALLQGYLSNDLELQKLVLQQEYTNLSNKANKINNIISIQLATGTLSFRAGSNPQITFHPGMNISLPIANNLNLSASSDITLMQNSSNVENTEISASLDILSPSNATRKVNALKSERQVLESERNILNAALLAEKKFYNELKSLYSSASSIAQSQNDLYDASISLNTLKARGYSSSSQNYRSAELKVLSEEHTVKTSQRAFERDLALFFARCGFSQNEKYTSKENSNAPSTNELNKANTG